jgi:hypothetical protein
VNWWKLWNLPDFGHVDSERPFRNTGERPSRSVAKAIAQLNRLPRSKAQHARVLRCFVAK